jgi:hypothetical protein
MAHHIVTLGLWSGRWWSSRGLLWDQYRKFRLLTVPEEWRRTAILNEFLDNKSALLTRLSHVVKWERHEHSCLMTRFPLLYPQTIPSYAAPKSQSSFCRTLYSTLHCPCGYLRNLFSALVEANFSPALLQESASSVLITSFLYLYNLFLSKIV